MKLLMENWRKYTNEMRDRYYAPGEAPWDPSPEEEQRHEERMQEVSDILDEAHEHPNELIEVTGAFYIAYIPEADEYQTFSSHSAQIGDYDKFYSSEQEEELAEEIAHALSERHSDYGIYQENKEKPCEPPIRKWKCRGSKPTKEGHRKLFLEISIDKE